MTAHAPHCTPAPDSGAIRTLLVDDSISWLKALRSFLEKAPGIRVAGIAGDGLEALHQLQSQPIDLVLLDMQMPRMSGLETLRHIRARHAGVRVVMLSSNDTPGIREECLARGAHVFVGKSEVATALFSAIFQLFPAGNLPLPSRGMTAPQI